MTGLFEHGPGDIDHVSLLFGRLGAIVGAPLAGRQRDDARARRRERGKQDHGHQERSEQAFHELILVESDRRAGRRFPM